MKLNFIWDFFKDH